MKHLRELRADRAKKVEEMRGVVDDAEAFGALDAEVRAIDEKIERAERIEEVERSAEARSIETATGEGSLADEWRSLARGEHRAMSVGGGATTGGAFVPEQLSASIQRRLIEISPFRSLAAVDMVSTGDYKIVISDGGMATRWSAETADRSTLTDTPAVRQITPTMGEINAYVQVSNELIEDAAFDVGSYILEEAAREFAKAEGTAFHSGDGVAKPTGWSTATFSTAADGVRTAGQVKEILTGTIDNLDATHPFDDLIDVVYDLAASYRQNAAWMMNSATAGVLRKVRDADGRYIWSDSLTAGGRPLLHGYPVVIDENMDAIGNAARPIAFGDWNRFYRIVDRRGMRVIRDEITNPGFTRLYISKRVGGIITDDNAVRVLKSDNA